MEQTVVDEFKQELQIMDNVAALAALTRADTNRYQLALKRVINLYDTLKNELEELKKTSEDTEE